MSQRSSERVSHNYLSLWLNPGPLEVTDHALVQKRRWCCATLAAFCLALVVNVCVGTTLVVWLNRVASERTSSLSLDVFVKEEVAREVSANIFLWERQQRSANFDNGTIDALHAFLSKKQQDGKDSPNDVIGWQKTRDNKDVDGISLDSERTFKIKKHGIYQIYSHLSFLGDEKTTSFQQVIKRHPDTTLLQNIESRTCDLVDLNEPCHTSVLFAALRLRQGDNIYIQARPLRQLVFENNASFFGIVKLE